MSQVDNHFVTVCEKILNYGFSDADENVRPCWLDGTPAYTKRILNDIETYQIWRNDVGYHIPVITLRKFPFKTAMKDLFWVYRDNSVNTADLGIPLWDSWKGEDGTIGKTYGYQIGKHFRHHRTKPDDKLYNYPSALIDDGWVTMSQLDGVIYDLRNNPASRRIIMTMWNVDDLYEMNLAPCCHTMQFMVQPNSTGGKKILHMVLYQRAQDMMTANGWDVTQHCVLLCIIAKLVDMIPGTFTHHIADCHIYDRHIPLVKEMIAEYHKHDVYPDPVLELPDDVLTIKDFNPENTKLRDYQSSSYNPKFEVAI